MRGVNRETRETGIAEISKREDMEILTNNAVESCWARQMGQRVLRIVSFAETRCWRKMRRRCWLWAVRHHEKRLSKFSKPVQKLNVERGDSSTLELVSVTLVQGFVWFRLSLLG
jgi:hypothetical protein